MKITPEKKEELRDKFINSDISIIQGKYGNDFVDYIGIADYWLNVLEEELKQAYNTAFDMAVEALPDRLSGVEAITNITNLKTK